MRAILTAFLLFSATEATAASWQVDPARSTLGFLLTWDREPFKGEFRRFTAQIEFDPADLAHAGASVVIDMTSMVTEDPENDKYRSGPNGLDAARFAQARFVTRSIRATGTGRYEALGELSLHGVTRNVVLPFALSIVGDTAHMTGELTLSRLDFGIGTGTIFGIDWSAERPVAHAVKVLVDLTATRRP